MTKKQGIRAILFLIVLTGVLWCVDAIYRLSPSVENLAIEQRFNELYKDKENTWDGILVGASNMDRAWAAPLAYEEYGMTVYPMSSDGCPFVLNTGIIEEVLKRQNLKFVVADLHGVAVDNLATNPVKVRRVTDNLKRSATWYHMIQTSLDYMRKYAPQELEKSNSTLKLSYYFPIVQYHSRIITEGIRIKDILPAGVAPMKGVYTASQHRKTHLVDLMPQSGRSELNELQKALLDDLIVYAKQKDIQLVFVKVPTGLKQEEEESMNAAADYVAQNGCKVLNFNDADVLEQCGLKGDEDFFDKQHLNTKGSAKFTEYMAGWLTENVDGLTDHRGDAAYVQWDMAAQEYDEFYNNSLKQIKKWLKKHALTYAGAKETKEEEE